MGITVLRSHMKHNKEGVPKTKHEKSVELWTNMKKFTFNKSSGTNELQKSLSSPPGTSATAAAATESGGKIMYSTNDVIRAEILLAMKCVTSHSQRSMDEFMKIMIPDSSVVKDIG